MNQMKMDTRNTFHDGQYMLSIYSPDGNVTLYDTKSGDWNTQPVFRGSLQELAETINNAKSIAVDLAFAKLQLEEKDKEIAELQDNQIREPIH